MLRSSLCCCSVISLVLLFTLPSCRPPEPPPLVAENLGTADRPLLPELSVSSGLDPAIMQGRATPVEVGEAEVEEEPELPELVPGEEAPPEVRDEVDEIIELVAESLADQDFEGLAELVVPDQQDATKRILAELGELSQSMNDLVQILQEKAPEMLPALQAMGGGMGGGGMPGGFGGLGSLDPNQEIDPEQLLELIDVVSVTATDTDKVEVQIKLNPAALGDNVDEATAAQLAGTVPVPFHAVDDEWFVYIPVPQFFADEELVDGVVRLGSLVNEQVDDVLTRLEDESLLPGMLMAEAMRIGQELQPEILALAPRFEALVAEFMVEDEGLEEEEADELEGDEDTGEADADEDEDEASEDEPEDEPEAPEPPRRGRGRGRGRPGGV